MTHVCCLLLALAVGDMAAAMFGQANPSTEKEKGGVQRRHSRSLWTELKECEQSITD